MSGYNGPNGSCGQPPSSSRIDISTGNNVTWEDAYQLDPTGPNDQYPFPPPAWTLTNQNFLLAIKGNIGQTGPLFQFDSGVTGCQLLSVDDVNSRILHFNVPDVVLLGTTGATGATGPGLIPGKYFYDFRMYDQSNPSIKIGLMYGEFWFGVGIGGP